MKKTILTALFAAVAAVAAQPEAEAQTPRPACSGSCSDMLQRCDKAAGGAACTVAFKRCLRTGSYVRPASKRTFSNLCKQ